MWNLHCFGNISFANNLFLNLFVACRCQRMAGCRNIMGVCLHLRSLDITRSERSYIIIEWFNMLMLLEKKHRGEGALRNGEIIFTVSAKESFGEVWHLCIFKIYFYLCVCVCIPLCASIHRDQRESKMCSGPRAPGCCKWLLHHSAISSPVVWHFQLGTYVHIDWLASECKIIKSEVWLIWEHTFIYISTHFLPHIHIVTKPTPGGFRIGHRTQYEQML